MRFKFFFLMTTILLLSIFIDSCNVLDEPVDPAVTNIIINVTTKIVSNIDSNTALCGGTVFSYDNIISRGIVWSTSSNPTIFNSKTIDAYGNGIYNSSLSGLLPATTYFVRAYATNSTGTTYGNQVTFITTSVSNLPILTTTAVSGISNTIAISGGYVSNSGTSNVLSRGVVWSRNSSPTIADSKTLDGLGNGTFVSTVTNLTPLSVYYLRAYATNSLVTAYGNEITFITTNVLVTLPTLTTTVVSDFTSTTAKSGGIITNDGGSAVIAKGICWSTVSMPTIINSKTIDGLNIGSFISSLTLLTQSTTYYVRAYATNSFGTAYGQEIIFTVPVFLIGQTFQGGTIFYVDNTGLHGLIVADSDQTSSPWGCDTISITGTLSTLGTGNANTDFITGQCIATNSAAMVCSNLTLNSYTDWYLPSKDELNLLYLNKTSIMNLSGSYWSSTQSVVTIAINEAYYQNFSVGLISTFIKYASFKVRAIRNF